MTRQGQESERSFICMLDVSVLPHTTMLGMFRQLTHSITRIFNEKSSLSDKNVYIKINYISVIFAQPLISLSESFV